ncbi:MAG: hypothetical protein JW797_15050 [Bradymonadales bacterium]|nr:hypothetical protein [Bradymonadales bacterium]
MKWEELLALFGREPTIRAALLRAGQVSDALIRLQLSRWTRSGRLVQLRRGLYLLGEPYRKVEPHPFLLANNLVKGSYVSLQSALAHHGLIPEHVPVVTSVTTGRPQSIETPLGRFEFRHVHRQLFTGYTTAEVAPGQEAFVASPEKALLDLVYLTPQGEHLDFLRELRLQNLQLLNGQRLASVAARFGKAKMLRAAAHIEKLRELETSEEA